MIVPLSITVGIDDAAGVKKDAKQRKQTEEETEDRLL